MRALIVVDMQKDFGHPDGSMYVEGSERLPAVINSLKDHFPVVVLTQDWHPPETSHFKDWPVHCVQSSWGSELVDELQLDPFDEGPEHLFLKKGQGDAEHGYSAFFKSQFEQTDLAHNLSNRAISEVFVCGLVLEHCVLNTALDAKKLGFKTAVVLDGTMPGDPNGGEERALRTLIRAGVTITASKLAESMEL